MKNLILCILNLLIALLALTACGRTKVDADGDNAIYYWRTTFTLNDAERNFLKDHNVTKLYIHFFDVDHGWSEGQSEKVVPEATIHFKDTVPAGIEVVPTVYITNSAMESMRQKEDEYAEKIYKRVKAMCRRHNLGFNEIQLDCDWTKSTRNDFFKLCEEMKKLLDSTQMLSSTIRLHQLAQVAPPVDKGVLMVYNTGNLMEMSTENSIFSYNDIAPYLRNNRLANYNLPLDVAYPTYGWSVVFHPGAGKYYFYRITRRTDFSDYPQIAKIDDNTYNVNFDVDFSPRSGGCDKIYSGCRIRVERPTADEILEVKKLIERQLADKPHHNILYHLDESQFTHYTDNEIDKIYSHN